MKIESQAIRLATPARRAAASAPLPYRPDIDGLRAVAVIAVVLFHAFPTVLRGGFIGVDIFFVISGFLISSILLKELREGRFSFTGFYARRIRRIFPALGIVMASCLAFGWFALFPDEYQQLGKHIVGGAASTANFFYWAQVGYFDTAAETKPLLHLWSLGIEEQFYILWPAMLLLAWRRGWNLLAVTGGVALLSFLVNIGGVAHHPSATFYSPASRAWELLLGAWFACRQARPAGTGAAMRWLSPNVRAWAGVALLAAGFVLVSRDRHFPGGLALIPTFGALLLIAAGPRAWFNRMVLSHPLMVGIGLISYPLYLWHWPLLAFAQIVESHLPALHIRIGAVALAALQAWLTWIVIERPLRYGRRRWKVALLAALMATIAGVGGGLYLNDGLPSRRAVQDNLANQKALMLVEDKANAAACKQRYGFNSIYKYCLLAHVDKDPTVALLGDSHAYHVVAGLTRYYEGRGENLLMLGTQVPYWDLPAGDNQPYQKATQKMLEMALAMDSVKTVIFSSHLHLHRSDTLYLDAARETFRRFLAAGKQVIVIEDLPTMPFDPRSCIARAGVASSATTSPCAIPRAAWEAWIAVERDAFSDIAREFPQIEWFRSSAPLCDDSWCRAMIDGRLMYRDDNHLSYDGDQMVGKAFAEWRAKLDK